MITFAKGVTSAYQPLAGLLARDPLVERVWDSPAGMFLHGSTFGGHPVATAVAVANMTALRDEDVFAGVLANEDRLGDGLRALMQAHPCVKDVRGIGYFYALELTRDRDSGAGLSDAEAAELLPGGVLDRLVREARVLVRPDGRGRGDAVGGAAAGGRHRRDRRPPEPGRSSARPLGRLAEKRLILWRDKG